MKKLRPRELRKRTPTPEEVASIPRQPLILVLDNVLDTFNLGAMFRLADAVATKKVYLCEETPTPPNHRIHRSAVGTEAWVPWEYCASTVELIQEWQESYAALNVIAVEQHPRSVPYDHFIASLPAAIVVGHETRGISKEVLALANVIVELPMLGVTRSLNVVASAAVVVYKLLEGIDRPASVA